MADNGAKTEHKPHSGHRYRLKKRFVSDGADSFEDHQLLELLLFFSIPRRDTNETAHALLKEFGTLDGIFKASINSLKKVEGVGEETAVMLKVMESVVIRRALRESLNNNKLSTTQDIFRYLVAYFADKSRETTVALLFDNKDKLKKLELISEGSVNITDVNSRKIVEASLMSNASYIVLAHNHPNGVAEPSAADIDATRSLIVMLRRLDIKVSDHIIIGGEGDCFSMKNDKKLGPMFL